MKRRLKALFLAVEVNLILWLILCGMLVSGSEDDPRNMAIIGLVFAAVFQHWAYYAVYKNAKQM
jgi:hypothetical protein